MDWYLLILKGILGGFGALGFSILFNVPQRTLLPIFLIGMLAIILKNICIDLCNINIILSAFICAATIGLLSSFASIIKKSPAQVFAIPSVIPLVPGVFIYKFMLGIITLSGTITSDFDIVFSQTVNFGLKSAFILMSLAIGVSLPTIILRKDSFYEGTEKRSVWSILKDEE